jgi:hypothetical protein
MERGELNVSRYGDPDKNFTEYPYVSVRLFVQASPDILRPLV